jgi:hypothetical protein
MRRYEHFSAVIVGLSCWLLLPPHCLGQERPLDARLFEAFYNKMVEILALGNPYGSSQLILANPGLLLEPWSDGDSPSDRYELFKLSDEALEPSSLARPAGRRISEIYAYLLENAEPDVPEPTPAEKERAAKARALLYNGGDSDKGESPAYQRYKDYKRKVEEQEAVLAKARQGEHPSHRMADGRTQERNRERSRRRESPRRRFLVERSAKALHQASDRVRRLHSRLSAHDLRAGVLVLDRGRGLDDPEPGR